MKNLKPKGKTPSLIGGSNGKPKRVSVMRQTVCARCKDVLVAGKPCIAIPRQGGAFSSHKKYCDECYQNILKQTGQDLEKIATL